GYSSKVFYDGKLSKDGNFPCASCHQQFAGFATLDHDLSHGFNNQFTIRNAPGLANLAWQTATEQANRGFSIERSYDGYNFRPIGYLRSAAPGGNSSNDLRYAFIDSSFTGLRQFYRLRQEDLDGRFRFSETILLTNAQDGESMQVYPIPATTRIFIRQSVATGGRYTFVLTDLRGGKLKQQQEQLGAGVNTTALSLEGVAAGTYLVEVRDPAGFRIGSALVVRQ
ncbi:MAG: T9SS type A sorting domain-containing protein, partial [Sphingobacteriales bacterium]